MLRYVFPTTRLFEKKNGTTVGRLVCLSTSRILDNIIHMKYRVSMVKFTLQLNIKLHDKRTQKVSTLIEVIDKP